METLTQFTFSGCAAAEECTSSTFPVSMGDVEVFVKVTCENAMTAGKFTHYYIIHSHGLQRNLLCDTIQTASHKVIMSDLPLCYISILLRTHEILTIALTIKTPLIDELSVL